MRRCFNLLIGLAFALRSLLPVGFMLAATPGHAGELQIVICTGHGPANLTLDANGVPQPQKSPTSAKDICPYSSAGAVAVNHATPHLLVRAVSYASLTYRIAREHFRATPQPRAHSARGPPAVLI
ncbi:DUF2946 family protein [Hyphomicrobium sp.]|jgi:hypothetical protein|uniref:DUF2946 family protein n=1 Tax=Hyphomicrobium sp. TaxID=82 RepID=UPI002C57F3B4|nr:DUF2946 family protein [Hyphomicrobium sp.]HVZ05006.1 DUF2946 family protein [Hyphomicrobium sp.]